MNLFFGIVAKKKCESIKKVNPFIEDKINYLIRKTMYDYIEPCSSVQFSKSGRCALFLYSLRNETLLDETDNVIFDKYSITNTGYPMDDYIALLEQNGCDRNCVSKLNGVFSLSILDKDNDSIRCYNNHMRLEQVYYAEDSNFYYVSTRALLLSAILYGEDKLVFDSKGIVSMLHRGYVACEGTVFKGITEMPIYSEMLVTPNGITFNKIENLENSYFTESLTAQMYDEFTDELLKATERIKNLYQKAKIGLTGGKDSRMMILAMNKVGANFSAETGGFDDSPDVIVARRIASMLGIEHSVYNNAKRIGNAIEEDILGRTQKVLFASDASIYGFEGCASTGLNYATDYALFNGLGGEILRGGYAKRLHHFTSKEVRGRIERIYNTMPDFFCSDVDKEYKESYLKGFENIQLDSPESMDWIYVQEHMGKWASSTMRCWGMRRLYLTPLCDEQLIKKALMIKTKDKTDDKLIFEIIKRLDSRFETLPLADARWSFEKEGPRKGDEDGYILREPIVAPNAQGAFSWRHQTLTDMREDMRNIIFDSSCEELFDYIKRSEVEKLFSKDNSQYLNNPYSRIFAWNIYSVAVLLEGSWTNYHNGKAGGFYNNENIKNSVINIPNKV